MKEREREQRGRKEGGEERRGAILKPVLFPGSCAPNFPFLAVLQVTERWVGLWAGLWARGVKTKQENQEKHGHKQPNVYLEFDAFAFAFFLS